MKFIIFVSILCCVAFSCSNHKAASANEKFDKIRWQTKEGSGYPFRENMLNDLITNYKLSGLRKSELLDLLGAPTRTDSSFLFYTVKNPHLGAFTFSNKSLVIKQRQYSRMEKNSRIT